MHIQKTAIAGTLESSDVQVTIDPSDEGLTLSISSSVLNQYGHQIRKTTLDVLARLGVTQANVTLVDKGALDCTIVARVECAVYRACGSADNIPWGGAQ